MLLAVYLKTFQLGMVIPRSFISWRTASILYLRPIDPSKLLHRPVRAQPPGCSLSRMSRAKPTTSFLPHWPVVFAIFLGALPRAFFHVQVSCHHTKSPHVRLSEFLSFADERNSPPTLCPLPFFLFANLSDSRHQYVISHATRLQDVVCLLPHASHWNLPDTVVPAIEKSQNNNRAEFELHGLHGFMIQE